ncbi:MAG: DUF1634 domain-containing protein [Phycisphaerae bacterium]|nr:DUF1634 domain-containing protein [Phycisphaerae bacterium]
MIKEATTDKLRERGSRVERVIAGWLRLGVFASVTLIAIGFVVSSIHNPGYLTDPEAFRRLTAPGSFFPHTISDLVAELLSLRGRAIITLGIIVLVLTPVVRVVLSIIAFAADRDWIYVAMTGAVLVLLLASFVVGAAH